MSKSLNELLCDKRIPDANNQRIGDPNWLNIVDTNQVVANVTSFREENASQKQIPEVLQTGR